MSDSVKKYYEAIEDIWYSNSTATGALKDSIVEEVKEIMDERSQSGIKEYGTTLADNPDGFWRWVNELQAELLDGALYLQKLKKTK
jgi:hypothetical protein